ncbi:PREDICTED: protein-methionine sulfoxide oxidase MICAL1 [Buceros rhinoceros silvestris]|nr:PREDICTED: protein-methionine sulfoxide oxidase MICAL1 [Buceros rhinoceros silvestris]
MSVPANEPGNLAHATFERFLRAGECREVLGCFGELCQQLGLQGSGLQLYHSLKAALNYWSAKALWNKLDKKAGHKDYDQGTACASTKCLVVGAGPCGLRAAIELALLGARVVLLEKRDSFSRNNVLHLWPFTIHDLRALGAKKFYGRFCTGTLDHISWRAVLQPGSSPLSHYEFDVLISAGGGKFVPEGFKRKEMRGKLAIGITTNFINRHSRAEVEVAEISGVARIYNQKFFQNLYNKTGIDLENIVYYKDDTHYFVMTAKKQSLLNKGVILQDKVDVESLLAPENVNRDALLSYAKEAANFSTSYRLPELEFALNHRHRPEAALGTGVAVRFLAACDAAWMVRRGAAGTPPLEVLAERESIYQHLSQTSPDNTNKNISQYSIDPATRYPNINLQAIKPSQVRDLYLVGMVEVDHKRKSNDTTAASPVVSGDAYEELLNWCQASTAGYRGVEVTNFTTSWTSGIQPVLSSTEMATMAEPDRLGLITYLSQFYEAFKAFPEAEEVSKKSLSPHGMRGAILFLSKLQKSRSLTRKRSQDSAQKDAEPKRSRRDAEPTARGESSDACYFCGHRVYILERASAEGRFFHRGCFQCRHCGATLRLGDYAFDEEDGHFYCSLHYPSPPSMDLPQDKPLALPDGQQDAWEEDEDVAMEEALEESDSEEEEEEEEGTDLGIMALSHLDLKEEARYAQTKRFCKAQAIQRRLEEIEVTFRELEQQGIKLEKLLRDEDGTSADQKTQWMNQLLYLVQKKNSLMSEESDLMIAVQELKLEEGGWAVAHPTLLQPPAPSESLKTPEDRVAEKEILEQLLEVVNKRNVLIHIQEEKRLSELRA